MSCSCDGVTLLKYTNDTAPEAQLTGTTAVSEHRKQPGAHVLGIKLPGDQHHHTRSCPAGPQTKQDSQGFSFSSPSALKGQLEPRNTFTCWGSSGHFNAALRENNLYKQIQNVNMQNLYMRDKSLHLENVWFPSLVWLILLEQVLIACWFTTFFIYLHSNADSCWWRSAKNIIPTYKTF